MINPIPYPWFRIDALNGFVILAVGLFLALTVIYSLKFMRPGDSRIQYYTYIILTAIASCGALLANNMLLLLVFWGFLGFTLYLLINMGDDDAAIVAKKSLIIVGGSDALMLLGIGMIYYLSSTFQMDKIKLELNNGLAVSAYLCIAIACFAKAGAMPFHSWIPDCARSAPVPVVAYLPASLDKLLGIYLLARLSLNLFVMSQAMNIFLMLIGAFTIICAVMMALLQHNLKRLLGYHAVSQVGYMVLGIGTANPIGIAGGLFHMLNHAIYKSCLFFGAGNVEYRTKTGDLDKLGGLAKLMPVTYICFMIASFSISGIPPFNGFVSKWLIYQGLIADIAAPVSKLVYGVSVFGLIAAIFGSTLTLASFIKLLHAVFMGQRINARKSKDISEVNAYMKLPVVVLAIICVVFGIFAFSIPLKYFIFPAISTSSQAVTSDILLGSWRPVLASALIIIGLILGFIIFKLGKLRLSLRSDSAFVGGEALETREESMVTGTDFYNTVKDMGWLGRIYKRAEAGTFDIYEQGKKIFRVSHFFQYLHNGVLPTYMVWVLLGMMALFWAMLR
ncbi:MAG: complex I subunit 5 family protein [Candidatus Omnitrophica bacterium]|nr:complex I subunit 5 family protein [Candidatus Omnitrophota bacterium]